MNPVPLFLIIVTLPLLFVGCGEKVAIDVKNVEEKVLEVKEEVKNKESIVETNSELGGVNTEELEERESIKYLKDSETPYTGKVYGLYENGQKLFEVNYKDGKREGLITAWHDNGLKKTEGNYKDGKFEGLYVWWHDDGQKSGEGNFKNGKKDGVFTDWHDNGQKQLEVKYKHGEELEDSKKWWNSKGEPVDSEEEAEVE